MLPIRSPKPSLRAVLPSPAPLVCAMLVACTVALPVAVQSQAASQAPAQAAADSGPRLQRVVIVRHDIFDSTDATSWYTRLANKLHVRTLNTVVERELLLHPGDPLDSARAAETGRNLRRLQVFRDVVVDTSADRTTLRVTTRDGWTTKPYATYRSTGRQKLYSIGMLETNFLGLAATLDARFVQDPDRSLMRLAFGAPRIFSNRISTAFFVNRLSDGSSAGAVVEQPYFSLSSRNAARIGFVTSDGRVLRFRNGNPRAVDSLDRRYTLGEVSVSHAVRASPLGYVRIGADAQVRRDNFAPRRDTVVAIGRTVTAAVTPFIELSHANYLLTHNYRMLGQPEDVNLSSTIRFGIAVAPSVFGYDKSYVGPEISAQTGLRFPKGFAQLTARVNGLASAGAIDSGTAVVSGTVALQPHPQHLLVAFSSLGWDKNPYPGEEFDLGLSRGPRGYQLHAFTGDRQRYSVVEYRWTVFPQIAKSFAAGVALFAETGGAWFNGSPRRDGKDAGIGLRTAPIRSAANIGASRFDLVRRFKTDREPAGWLVVVGTGFTFDSMR